MLLPQSSAFVTLRNRLNAVNGLGFLHSVPRSSYATRTAAKDGSGSGVAGSTGGTGGGVVRVGRRRWRRSSGMIYCITFVWCRTSMSAHVVKLSPAPRPQGRPKRTMQRHVITAGPASSTSSTAGGAARRRISQAATPSATGSMTPSGSAGRFGLGLSASSATNGRGTAPNTGTSSFFGIHLPSTAGATSTSRRRARRRRGGTSRVSSPHRMPGLGTRARVRLCADGRKAIAHL